MAHKISIQLFIKPSFIKIEPSEGSKSIFDNKVVPYIDKYFTIEDKRNRFNVPRVNGFPLNKKYVHFYYKEFGLLPIGFGKSLITILKEKIPQELGIDVEYSIKDLRHKKKIDLKGFDFDSVLNNPKFKLRYYQTPAIKSWFDNKCIGLIEGSVASGKTLMFAIITKIINEPTLIVMGRKDLVHGGMEEFIKEYGFAEKDIGIVQGDNYLERKITFCTIQSLEKLQNLEQFKLLIFDECHHTSAETYQKLLMTSNAPYRLGVSGTISELDIVNILKIKSYLGDIVYKIGTKELIENKVLAQPTVYSFNILEPEVMEHEYGSNWLKIENDLVVGNEYRNGIIADLALHYFPWPCLIIVRRIPHGEALNKMIPGSVFLNGVSPDEDRKKFRHMMDKGTADIVISTDIFGEGINLKELASVIPAAAMKSFVIVSQRAGRGLRRTETKTDVAMADFWDQTHRILERQSETRFRRYKKNGFIIEGPFDGIDENFPLKRIR